SGGNYEIGDDLLLLGKERPRMNLVQNRDLLNMIHIGRAATPIDLLTYDPEDEQPSIFFLRESPRQAILVIFNWTKSERTHQFKLADLGLPGSDQYAAIDVFNSSILSVENGVLQIPEQLPESVKVLKLVDADVPVESPSVTVHAPTTARAGETLHFSATADPKGTPAVAYHWDFGDGVTSDSRDTTHTFTTAGDYKVGFTAEGL